jgi:hypothetical protein
VISMALRLNPSGLPATSMPFFAVSTTRIAKPRFRLASA